MIYIRYQYLSQQCQISNPQGQSDASLLKSKTLQRVQAPIVQRDQDALLRSECDGEARVSGLRGWGMTWKICGKTFRISKHGKNQVTNKCNHNWPEVKTHFGALHQPNFENDEGIRHVALISGLLFQMQQPNGRKRWINAPQTSTNVAQIGVDACYLIVTYQPRDKNHVRLFDGFCTPTKPRSLLA